jgi:hypothetical protein
MKNRILTIILSLFVLQSCDVNKSINKDFSSGLSTIGNGLSCENVYLTVNDNETTSSTYTYGETFYLNFNNIVGFKKEGEFVFPGMSLHIVSEKGDTVMQHNDMYSDYTDGIDLSPLLLHANITVASPMFSNNKYTLYTTIWDKKGEGTFKAELDFDIIPNEFIKIENNNVTYDNIYLFSAINKATITDNNAKLNEDIYLIFEGITGFKEENGKASIGLSILAKDAEETVIINEEDLIGEDGMDLAELKKQIAPNFTFSGDKIINPINCEIIIWDKKSDARIKASVNLNLK